MTAPNSVVIVGGGLGGAKTAQALRDRGFTGRVTVLAGEPDLPYERPPLSKSYLAGGSAFDEALVHPAKWYDDHDVDLRLATWAERIDLAGHRVEIRGGEPVSYDRAVLATGSSPRRLPLPGADAEGVYYLRERPDADALRQSLAPGAALVVIGAGWIGLEVAAVARQAGVDVTVLEAAPTPLRAVLGERLGEVFASLHHDKGVALRFGAGVRELVVADGRVRGVALDDGRTIDADAVLVGVGAAPNTALAASAGLAVDNGVLVDAALRTSDPDVLAVGDIANQDHPVLGRLRVEHWANALNQPAAAAATALGEATAYRELPYFYTDQYDLGMEYIGHTPPGNDFRVAVRGDTDSYEFVALWLDGETRLRAAMAVNVWDVIDPLKELILAGRPVDVRRLTDPSEPLAGA